MPPRVSENQLSYARNLRRNVTRAEQLVWTQLRGSRLDGLKFRRQVPVGAFIADFLCVDAKLIVELDGTVHDHPDRRERDEVRDKWLASNGYMTLRFSNTAAIFAMDGILDEIRKAVRERRHVR